MSTVTAEMFLAINVVVFVCAPSVLPSQFYSYMAMFYTRRLENKYLLAFCVPISHVQLK